MFRPESIMGNVFFEYAARPQEVSMVRWMLFYVVALGFLILLTPAAHATLLFNATLDCAQETGGVASTATGFGTVVLNDAEDQITVNLSWSGLTAPATASHIHGPAAPGFNAAVVFPFSGVPSVTAGVIPEQVFTMPAARLADFKAGLYYFNIHTSNFPGGEIRGQINLVPEPATLSMLVLGGLMLWHKRR
jgi:hypothetical protein